MRGKVSKQLRRLAGYDEYAYRNRTYTQNGKQVLSDSRRRLYQKMKKEYREE